MLTSTRLLQCRALGLVPGRRSKNRRLEAGLLEINFRKPRTSSLTTSTFLTVLIKRSSSIEHLRCALV
ncbi:hypothetical protein PCANC_19336 [Puccinia coronata f. sp. avenae]|uniref:Uncharacterized protein n=1 Tax=Puccinia coronata f. sp. avenae TaxID=200324 RepID=A0A2N5S6U2_9BASI|nr:hypothetical protein PCANC_19336 [Puccinia coronata f. sp. avenae]